MLSKIIKLEDIYNDYMETDFTYCPGDLEIGQFMQVTIEAFKTLTDEVIRLKDKVKRLEQEGSYFNRVENIKEVRNLNG